MLRSCVLIGGVILAGIAAGTAEAKAPSALGRMICHPYKEIVRQLGAAYKETPVSLGLQTNGHVLQVFASPETGSWTILSVAPTGVGCVVAAGRNWEQMKPKEPEGPIT